MECFVCVETCTFRSPCPCGIPVCRTCLFQLHWRGFHHCAHCGAVLRTRDWLLFIFLFLFRLYFIM